MPDHNIVGTLNEVLPQAEKGSYAVGSFSPRYTSMICPVLLAGQAAQSPLIVQISQKELARYQVRPEQFAGEFFRCMREEKIDVPVVLHLDHTKDFAVIQDAIQAGFTSVMIDASDKPLAENAEITQKVVAYAHARGVSVEAELGRIGTADFIETDQDEEFYTRPDEAAWFVQETKVDALAISVGTAHGVYTVRQPKVDLERIRQIRALTRVHLVLHGGSGVPAGMVQQAIHLPGGGISKVNIATDLELSALAALGLEKYILDAEMLKLPAEQLKQAQAAVIATVSDKMIHYLNSSGRAR